MDDLGKSELPQGMDLQWTELTYLQIQAGNTAIFVFGAAVVLVFLVLAAQYESLTLPLAVILVVPMCLLCSVIGVCAGRHGHQHLRADRLRRARRPGQQERDPDRRVRQGKVEPKGVAPFDATVEACRLRLRPIIMTSLAFILGVVPLVLAVGAGAEMRSTLGIAVFSGMLGVTLFGIFLTPVFYYVIVRLFGSPVATHAPVQAEVVAASGPPAASASHGDSAG